MYYGNVQHYYNSTRDNFMKKVPKLLQDDYYYMRILNHYITFLNELINMY